MHTTYVPFGGIEPNPLAEQICEQHGQRLDALFDLIWPEIEGNKPFGVVREFSDYTTATDEQARRITFSTLGEFYVDGVEDLEENVAQELESLAAAYVALARQIRSELVK